ncbi:MAG TPA: hypothetical protein VM347_16995 [Nonomuraea sp.]|nr:hypothetical protein [Nonomuraea sp.]
MPEYFKLAELGERGWTPTMIRKLLDPPDLLRSPINLRSLGG